MEKQSEELQNQSTTLNNISEKIDEILAEATRNSRDNDDDDFTHTCSEFTILLSNFTSALGNADDGWIEIASDIISANVETCTSDELSDLQSVKDDADEKINKKNEEITEQISDINQEISEKDAEINEKESQIDDLNDHLDNLMKSTTTSTTTTSTTATKSRTSTEGR